MQGTFQRQKAAAAEEALGVPADLLRHDNTTKSVLDMEETQRRKDEAAAAVGDGEEPAPVPDVMKNVVVYPPPQKFKLDKIEFIILEDTDDKDYRPFQKSGYWIVPYVIVNSGGTRTARPEHVSEKLIRELQSEDWGSDFDDMDPAPDREYARLHVDFEQKADNLAEINFEFLKNQLDAAEQAEYNFALRMQGLLNCSLNAVWTCTEFGFDNADRSHIMEQFLQKYIGRFLSQVTQKPEEMDPDKIVREALQMHSRFSAGWTKEHKKGLAPTLDSCSEALVGHFVDGPLKILIQKGLTRKEIARFLRRHEDFSPQFGLCLHFFMVKLEQDKNGRNANYKSMFNATTSQLLQMRTLEGFLRSKVGFMQGWYDDNIAERLLLKFHEMTMDWYYIISQLHAPTVQYTGVKRSRSRMARSAPGMFFAQST